MNKKMALFISMALLVSPISVQKAQAGEMIPNTITFTKETGSPYVDANNRTMVPLRVVVETLGCDVEWNQQIQIATITKGNNTIEIPIGKKEIKVNGQIVINDTEANIIDGRTYLPIRSVVEGLGGKVDWNQPTNQALVTLDNNLYIIQIPKKISQNEVNQLIASIEQNIKDADYYRNNWVMRNDDGINTWINNLSSWVDSDVISYNKLLEGKMVFLTEVPFEKGIVDLEHMINQRAYGLRGWNAVKLEKAGLPNVCSTDMYKAELTSIKNKKSNLTENDIKSLKSINEKISIVRHDAIQYGQMFIDLNYFTLDSGNFSYDMTKSKELQITK